MEICGLLLHQWLTTSRWQRNPTVFMYKPQEELVIVRCVEELRRIEELAKRSCREAKGEKRSSQHLRNTMGASRTRQHPWKCYGNSGNKETLGKHYGSPRNATWSSRTKHGSPCMMKHPRNGHGSSGTRKHSGNMHGSPWTTKLLGNKHGNNKNKDCSEYNKGWISLDGKEALIWVFVDEIMDGCQRSLAEERS